MQRPYLVLEDLFRLLPDLEELDGLRLSLIGASVSDPERTWERSSAFATVDKRLVAAAGLDAMVDEVERDYQAYVASLFSHLRPVLRACAAAEPSAAARPLIALGEWLEQQDQHAKARDCFVRALALALPQADKASQILALRRIARVTLALGEFSEALRHYQRSAELARDSNDALGAVIARTGQGNALALQGRWAEAEQAYQDALATIETSTVPGSMVLERAQLYNNLGLTALRQGQLTQAGERLELARALWDRLASPRDLAICLHSQALLREEEGRREEARAAFAEALAQEVPAAVLAPIAIDLAESYLRDGHLLEAREWGRRAEQYAIAGRSPYYLARVYRGLGSLARDTGEEGGLTFFEKALEIARESGFRLLEAETLVEYARLRERTGGEEEARAFLEHATEIFREIGAVAEQQRAEALLQETAPPAIPPLGQ